jgi:hypothetical protein
MFNRFISNFFLFCLKSGTDPGSSKSQCLIQLSLDQDRINVLTPVLDIYKFELGTNIVFVTHVVCLRLTCMYGTDLVCLRRPCMFGKDLVCLKRTWYVWNGPGLFKTDLEC